MRVLAGGIIPCSGSALPSERPLKLDGDFHVAIGTCRFRLRHNLASGLGSEREGPRELRAQKLKESRRDREAGHNDADGNLSIGPEPKKNHII